MNQALRKFESGFSIIEVIIASAVFIAFASGAIVAVISAINTNRLGAEQTIAIQYTSEGLEAVQSIRNQANGFTTLAGKAGAGNQGVAVSGGVWNFSGTSNTLASDNRFVRTIAITSVQRDTNGNIVSSGGTIDPNTYKITATTSWNFNSARTDSVQLTKYLTNWKSKKGGMIIYGNGGTTTDAVQYRTFDASANTWSTAATAFDVDPGTTNKALRTVRLYSSTTRNEKIAISRHYNGTAQFIYATVWNGTSWGTPTQLSTWTATTFLDVLNYDGAYLNDGTFMAIYSDNTIIPKYRIWNGTSWSAQSSLTTLGTSQIPSYIVAKARPGTNEVMAAFFTQGSGSTAGNTITQYWSGSAWSAITTHATAAPLNTKRMVDFAWSQNTPTTGALVYADSATDKNLTTRLFVADGIGGGSWGTAVNAGTAQTNSLGPLTIIGRPGANEFQACNKDAGTTPTIICQKIIFSGTPTVAGYSTQNGTTDANNLNWINSTQITTPATGGALQSITVYLANSDVSPNNHVEVALYTDNGSNAPGTLLASSGSYVITPNSWNTIPITGVTITPTTKYFLAFSVDGNNTQYGWNSTTTGVTKWKNLVSFGTWPSSFGTPDDSGVDQYAIYMTYTVSGVAPTISNPTNATIASATDTGIQKSYDIGFESLSGDPALAVYSDNTSIPKFKKYTASSSTWDASATSITTTGTPGVFKLVRMIPQDQGDDMMTLMSDANNALFSIFWNGSGNAMYTTPASKAYTAHGTTGSATTDYWFDFAWDRF